MQNDREECFFLLTSTGVAELRPPTLRFTEGVAEFRPPGLWSGEGVAGLRRPADFRRGEYGKGYAEQGSDDPAGAGLGLDRKCVVN